MSYRDEIADAEAYRQRGCLAPGRLLFSGFIAVIWYGFISWCFFGKYWVSQGRPKGSWLSDRVIPPLPLHLTFNQEVIFWAKVWFCVLSSCLMLPYFWEGTTLGERLRQILLVVLLSLGFGWLTAYFRN